MNKKLIWGIVIAIVVIVAAYLAFTYYLSNGFKKAEDEFLAGNEKVNNNLVTSPTTSTTELKTYKDSKYGFSVEYPSIWTASKGEESDMGGFHYTHFGISNIYEKPLVWIRVYENQTTLESFLKYFKGLSGTWSSTVVAGIPARQFTNINQDNRGIILIAFVKDGYGYEVASTAFGQYGYVANEMAASFKFVSSSLVYSGIFGQDKIPFSIKYPSDWVYFKFSCNAGGLAFWPKTSAPIFPTNNACPANLIDSAPISVITDSKPEITVNDKNYEEIAKQFTITN